MKTEEATLTKAKASSRDDREGPAIKLEPAVHRRILRFINDAIRPEDLVYERLPPPNPEIDPIHEDNPEEPRLKRKRILDPEIAKEIVEFRDREFPLGFRNLTEVLALKIFDRRYLDILLRHFSNLFYGSWSVFPRNIPRRGPGAYDGVVHAALLHTGKVLFIAVYHRR